MTATITTISTLCQFVVWVAYAGLMDIRVWLRGENHTVQAALRVLIPEPQEARAPRLKVVFLSRFIRCEPA